MYNIYSKYTYYYENVAFKQTNRYQTKFQKATDWTYFEQKVLQYNKSWLRQSQQDSNSNTKRYRN